MSLRSDPGGEEDEAQRNRRRLLEMARSADALAGDKDEKLKKAVEMVKDLLKDGFRPILFCRFIPTAEYVAAELRHVYRRAWRPAVTGLLPPAERRTCPATGGVSQAGVGLHRLFE
jgi:hypothetical protein